MSTFEVPRQHFGLHVMRAQGYTPVWSIPPAPYVLGAVCENSVHLCHAVLRDAKYCWRAQRPSVSSSKYAIYVHLSRVMRAVAGERGANLLLEVNNGC